MDHVNLGRSGLLVSKFVYGTLTVSGTNGFEAIGSATGQEARRVVDIARDAG